MAKCNKINLFDLCPFYYLSVSINIYVVVPLITTQGSGSLYASAVGIYPPFGPGTPSTNPIAFSACIWLRTVTDDAAGKKLTQKLTSLAVRPAIGKTVSPLAPAVSGKKFFLPNNDQGIEFVTLQFNSDGAALVFRTSSGESRINCGASGWRKGQISSASGLTGNLVAPTEQPAAASGAWTSDDTYTMKLCLYETPFYITYVFRFNGDRLFFDCEYNVAFGPTKLPQLTGYARSIE